MYRKFDARNLGVGTADRPDRTEQTNTHAHTKHCETNVHTDSADIGRKWLQQCNYWYQRRSVRPKGICVTCYTLHVTTVSATSSGIAKPGHTTVDRSLVPPEGWRPIGIK